MLREKLLLDRLEALLELGLDDDDCEDELGELWLLTLLALELETELTDELDDVLTDWLLSEDTELADELLGLLTLELDRLLELDSLLLDADETLEPELTLLELSEELDEVLTDQLLEDDGLDD